jgi:hypothetical protein
MPTLEGHSHTFADWPFDCTDSTGVFTTARVLEDGFPILVVSHDEDGDWQFLCGTTTDYEDCRLICMGCALERDSSLAEIADLPMGWFAERDSVGKPWERFPRPDDGA